MWDDFVTRRHHDGQFFRYVRWALGLPAGVLILILLLGARW